MAQDETVEMLCGLTLADMIDDNNPGGTGDEEQFRNYMLREIAVQLARIASALEKQVQS